MSNQEILERAIQKAIDGGWRGDVLGKTKWKFCDHAVTATLTNGDEEWSFADIFFMNKSVAKALWGEEVTQRPTEGGYEKLERWEHHLQLMVIADDPIKYLGENI